jgi:hypothetical protein
LPAQPGDTVVEFYVLARDAQGNTRTWPAPVWPDGTKLANCLYQVDDGPDPGWGPFHRLITTEAERFELAQISAMPWYWSSDAQMNATFISAESGQTDVRYNVGFRTRGSTSRDPALPTRSRRVNFAHDRPWRGQRAVALNAHRPQSQVIASVICQLAGVPAAKSRFVQVRENNRQLAALDQSPYGWYAEVEVTDSAFAAEHFPNDPNGNLYRADGGNLDYLGEDPAAYGVVSNGVNYTKATHASENDWSDLIRLTRTLSLTPDSEYTRAVRDVADVTEWARYFAVFTMLGSTETSLATGANGDYLLYRGVSDPRFLLLARDLDSTLGMEGGLESSITRAASHPVVKRFLSWPEFGSLYYQELRRQSETLFAPAQLNALLDQFIAGHVPTNVLQAMKDFGAARRAFVLSRIPATLIVTPDLPYSAWHPYSTNASVSLHGLADAARTVRVLVSGQEATLDAIAGAWSIKAVPLYPGNNLLLVQALDSSGQQVSRQIMPIWYDTGRPHYVSGTLAGNTYWDPAQGPYQVTGDLIIPPGVTLTIGPGTSVFLEQYKNIVVQGRLLAEGTDERRILLTPPLVESYAWGNVQFQNATNESRLRYLHMVYLTGPALWLSNSVVLVDQVEWAGTRATIIQTTDSSLAVRHCVFPNVDWAEIVAGEGIPAGGHMIFEGNVFGRTVGYNDIIDFTGGHRPGPIIQVLNNVFTGGSDDGVDLDGTDAHIEGNVFMHFHKVNTSTSISSAISTGSYANTNSSVTVVRNVFYDNDYDFELKEHARLTAQNNTLVGSQFGSISFTEPLRPGQDPPDWAQLDGCIFWNLPAVLTNLDLNLLSNATIQVRVDRSILPQPGPWSGTGNLNTDPRFVGPTNDFRLRPDSPARGAGPFGADMGAYVPAGPWIAGEPPSETWQTSATLQVAGPGITHYRYRLNAGTWSAARLVSTPIQLLGLPDGEYTVAVLGQNSAGVWQDETQPTLSRHWTVNHSLRRLRLSEILACNNTVASAYAGYPDLVELYNDSPEPADLSDLSLTDDPAQPRKFVFPPGTAMPANAYLVLAADRSADPAGFHLGFAMGETGDSLCLYDRAANGGGLLDRVSFGLQVPDLSIGRLADGQWSLTRPTFGGPNVSQALGDARRLRINEWLANPDVIQHGDFLELYNPETLPVSLAGFALTDKPLGAPARQIVVPLSFVPGGGYAVFYTEKQLSGTANHLGFHLDAAQGMIGLFAPDGSAVDTVAYGPQAPDRSQGRDPSGSVTVLTFITPTPGGDSPPATNSTVIVLNEILANNQSLFDATGRARDWIELCNLSPQTVELAGLSLGKSASEAGRWVFPAGTTIAALGRLIVYCDAADAVSATNTGFGLGAHGDTLCLFDRPAQGSKPLDTVTFGLQAADYSLGRVPDGTGAWLLNPPTPQAKNRAALLGDASTLRINEWMARPVTGEPDWFELYNGGPHPVALGGLHLTDDLTRPTQATVAPLSFIGIGRYAYQLFIADEDEARGPDHVGFRLSAGGETIGLAEVDGSMFEVVVFGAQETGVSEGRLPDGSAYITAFRLMPTPGRRNSLGPGPDVSVLLLAGERVRLSWAASVGATYQIESSPALGTTNWAVIGTVTATDTEAAFVTPADPVSDRYYRVGVSP